jgi:hypothetical protein
MIGNQTPDGIRAIALGASLRPAPIIFEKCNRLRARVAHVEHESRRFCT